MNEVVVGIDVGSSAVKALAFDRAGRPVRKVQRPLSALPPEPGRVELDPGHVRRQCAGALVDVLTAAEAGGSKVRCIGLACQRSSFLLWQRDTGRPLTPVISWQDLRAAPLCASMAEHRDRIYEKTGLPLTAHYGGPKFLWLRRHRSSLFRRLDSPGAVFSPLSSFLLHHLTGGRPAAVDESIAGRTLLVDIAARRWDPELIALFEMPPHLLPQIVAVCRRHGGFVFGGRTIPIECCIGDQQAALAALGGLQQGRCVLSLGTSGGVLVDTGRTPAPAPGLLLSVARSSATEVSYAAEGTINAVGSLFEWFETEQHISGAAVRWDRLAADASDGWQMIPGMFGIAAPYWRETAPTVFAGEGLRLSPAVRLRAGMEAIALLIADIVDRIQTGTACRIDRVVASGGAAKGPLLQCTADLLGREVMRSAVADATALGCAFLAGRRTGFWEPAVETGPARVETAGTFSPRISEARRRRRLSAWHRLLRQHGILDRDPSG